QPDPSAPTVPACCTTARSPRAPPRTLLSVSLLPAPAPPELSTLSLHDALPICLISDFVPLFGQRRKSYFLLTSGIAAAMGLILTDRKSTRLNSSHVAISYAVFCLKKKNYQHRRPTEYGQQSAQRPHRAADAASP